MLASPYIKNPINKKFRNSRGFPKKKEKKKKNLWKQQKKIKLTNGKLSVKGVKILNVNWKIAILFLNLTVNYIIWLGVKIIWTWQW